MTSMAESRLVEPRLDTPSPRTSGVSGTRGLPDSVVSEHVRRLAVCSAVGAGLWAYGLVVDSMVRPLSVGTAVSYSSIVVEILSIVVSVIMFVYVRYAPHAADRKADAGLFYFVLNAVGVAVINTQTGLADLIGGRGLSWNTVVILIAAMILPARPVKMLVASLASAATDPLAAWIAHLNGAPMVSAANTLVLYLPNFACAAVAILPSHVLHRLGRRLRQAQEMGSYQLVELLGRGGMGEVWRAKHRLLARGAAIKLIRPELLGAGSHAEAYNMLRRFEREAQATAALSSPHTIQVFDFGATADQTFYYVMELLDGRDLQSLVREFGPLPATRALFLLRQVCHSLAEAHARGLVHRDVTPSNIYVCRRGLDYDFVKVLDFGLVKFDARRDMEQTLMGGRHDTAGTPAWSRRAVTLASRLNRSTTAWRSSSAARPGLRNLTATGLSSRSS